MDPTILQPVVQAGPRLMRSTSWPRNADSRIQPPALRMRETGLQRPDPSPLQRSPS